MAARDISLAMPNPPYIRAIDYPPETFQSSTMLSSLQEVCQINRRGHKWLVWWRYRMSKSNWLQQHPNVGWSIEPQLACYHHTILGYQWLH